jgi:hypothetical protein
MSYLRRRFGKFTTGRRRAVASAKGSLICALALLSPTPTIGQDQAGGFLANPAVRLWYEETGRLSENILGANEFYLWNTMIGEGSAEEQANDALFTIDLRNDGQQNIPHPLTLTATDESGKVLARRSFANLLTSEGGMSRSDSGFQMSAALAL